MFGLTALELARIQFGFTISTYHLSRDHHRPCELSIFATSLAVGGVSSRLDHLH